MVRRGQRLLSKAIEKVGPERVGFGLRAYRVLFFFFQAEDGIRDLTVTGVQTCALPILMVLACARATHGVANVTAPAPISASVERRLTPGLLVLVISPPRRQCVPQIPAGDRAVSMSPENFRESGMTSRQL